MSTIKITELDAMLSGSVVPANDVVAIVDIAGNATKKITLDELGGAMTVASASVEILTEVSSSHAQTADIASGLQGTPSVSLSSITASGGTTLSGSLDIIDPFGSGKIRISGSILTITGSVKNTGSFTTSGSFVVQGGDITLNGSTINKVLVDNVKNSFSSTTVSPAGTSTLSGATTLSGSVVTTGSSVIMFDNLGTDMANFANYEFSINGNFTDGEGTATNIQVLKASCYNQNRGLLEIGSATQAADIEFKGNSGFLIMGGTGNSPNFSGSLIPNDDNSDKLGVTKGMNNFITATKAYSTASINFITGSQVKLSGPLTVDGATGLTTTNVTASGVISASGGTSYFKALDLAEGNITNVGGVTCDQLFSDADVTTVMGLNATNFQFSIGEADKAIINAQGLNVTGAVTASVGIKGTIDTAAQAKITTLAGATSVGQALQTTNFPGIMTVDQGVTVTANGVTVNGGGIHYDGIVTAAATDAAFYSVNGQRVEVRSQLQAGVAADTGWTLQLRNTSIAANSLIVTNVIGGDGAIITGSVVTTNVVSANTASLNFFNTGIAIADNAKFTASIAIF